MSKALDMLTRVKESLSTPWSDDDRVSITPTGRVKLAQLHRDEMLDAFNVSAQMQRVIASIGQIGGDSALDEHWLAVRETSAAIMAEGRDGYAGDAEHMLEYCRMLVALRGARAATRDGVRYVDIKDTDVEQLEAACAEYLARHLRAVQDYAPDIIDTKARVLHGCTLTLNDTQFDQWLADVDVLAAKFARHEYSKADVQMVRSELLRVVTLWESMTEDLHQLNLVAQVREQFDKITTVIERHSMGPAHLEALEHQWRSYKFNRAVIEAGDRSDVLVGALQDYTITALRVADTYCWAPQTTQAVLAAADGLPIECAPSVSALGDIAQVGRSGWWWFQEPLQVQTTDKSGVSQPVVALLWRYGLQDTQPMPDFPQLKAEPRVGLWLQTFVMDRLPLNGRPQDVAIPSIAWIWHDGTTLQQLPARMRREYARVTEQKRNGYDMADMETTLSASMLFSRFFMASAAWLRQKIVIESHGGQGIRQAARQLQRQHGLDQTPRVRIVELRRSQYVKREDATVTDGAGRKLTCRFVVKGFWRNQWYATRQEHAQIYIESFLKGPSDAPLKTAAPTVFVVRR